MLLKKSQTIIKTHRIPAIGLYLMSAFCFLLSVSRVIVTGQLKFLFLNWNLFLAFVPWAFTTWLITHHRHRQKSVGMVVSILLVWLIFFPNAPYILTDLIHLQQTNKAPMWFDLILLISFGWTGLMFGFVSLFDIEILLSSFISSRLSWLLITSILFISGYGIYLGRFGRFNSWDIIYNPFKLFHTLWADMFHPFHHAQAWGVTLFMGMLLNMMFWSVKLLKNNRDVLPH